jgi:RimJ/RimL family protein N-acetyltransferase
MERTMLVGKKVKLRAVEEKDLNFCQSLYNDDHLRGLVVGWDFPISMHSQEKWFKSMSPQDKNNIRLIIETYDGTVIGLTGLWNIDWHNRNALTAIKLKGESLSGKGFGRDAIMLMNAYSFFDVGLVRLWGTILEYNIPSFNSYVKKSGWIVEGLLRKHIFRNGYFHNLYYVGCLIEDFLKVVDSRDYIPEKIPSGLNRIETDQMKFGK